jgi:hypothetical protein
MSRHKKNVDQRMATELSGPDKLRALLSARAGSVSRWAVNQSFIPEQVFMCLSGKRPYPEIRDLIAKDLGLVRKEVDELIEASAATTVG